jgi:Protein of unknown function (DUF3667)
MSGEFEAAGTAIEGALIGAAVEEANRALGGGKGSDSSATCLNCGAQLNGPFCANCGQKAEVHRTMSAIGHDILHSVLHFDGKLWRTLPLLAFKPGELTRRYIHGERAKFVSPMAIFLFAIFLMFAVSSFSGDGPVADGSDWRAEMNKEAVKLDKNIAEAETKLKATLEGSSERAALREKLADMKSERNGIAFATTGKPIYEDVGATTSSTGPFNITARKSSTGWKWLDKKLNDGGKKLVENPSLAFYKMQSNGYKFAWLLIPLSLPFVWLVTLGVRGRHFYDHAVFTTYSITFMCFLFIFVSLIGWAGLDGGWLALLFFLAPPLHLYKQLRHSYGLSRAGTLLRMIPLIISIVIVSSSFMLILLLMGMM